MGKQVFFAYIARQIDQTIGYASFGKRFFFRGNVRNYCSARTGSAKSVVHPLWARMWVPVVVVVW